MLCSFLTYLTTLTHGPQVGNHGLKYFLLLLCQRGMHSSAGTAPDAWSQGCKFEPCLCLHVVCLSEALYSNLLLSTHVYEWVPAFPGKVTGCGRLAILPQHYKLNSLAQLLVESRWVPLDALKTVLTKFAFFTFLCQQEEQNSKLEVQIKEMEDDRTRLQRSSTAQQTQIEKYKRLSDEAKRKSEGLETQLAAVRKVCMR